VTTAHKHNNFNTTKATVAPILHNTVYNIDGGQHEKEVRGLQKC